METCKLNTKEDSKPTFVWNTQQASKKSVRFFAPKSKRCQVEYIEIPSASECKHLYYSAEEQHAFVEEILRDIEDAEQGRLDSDDWTARGLEAGTKGTTQRNERVWDAVLDEQDRQWDTLPQKEPCDDMAIARASLEATQEARKQAHLLGLQDQEEIHGCTTNLEEKEGLMEEDSMATHTTASLSTLGEEPTLRSKEGLVHWSAPTTEAQVFQCDRDQTQQESKALWLSYGFLGNVKQRVALSLA